MPSYPMHLMPVIPLSLSLLLPSPSSPSLNLCSPPQLKHAIAESCKAVGGGTLGLADTFRGQDRGAPGPTNYNLGKMEGEIIPKVMQYSQKVETELQKLGLKIKHHEDNLKYLKTQANNLDGSILDIQVILGKFHSSEIAANESQSLVLQQTELQTLEHVLQQEKAAASIICKLKLHHGPQSSKLPATKDVLGVVATLGKVKDDNLSRLFSEYLGLETMLAIVCKTYEGVRALEEYDKDGMINKSAGLHGLGPSIGRPLDGRFLVICLECLRPYTGDFVAEDPQKRLAVLKPRLPNGECPPGFLGFAVNMIDLEDAHLSCVRANGHGLRETLFYSLFSRLQVYKTRADMQLALPYISDGAISLDGGMVKSTGLFYLGNRQDLEVRFPISSGISSLPAHIVEAEEQFKLLTWKRENLTEDMQREEALLFNEKNLFNIKRNEMLKCITDTAHLVTQTQVHPLPQN